MRLHLALEARDAAEVARSLSGGAHPASVVRLEVRARETDTWHHRSGRCVGGAAEK